jgi:SulP family sulfate permease
VSEGLRKRAIVTVSAGAVIGVVEVVLAISFAVLVFSGFLEDARPSGIGIYLVAASLTLAILAWRAGVRGVVGSVQDAAVPVLAIVASSAALHTFGGVDQAFLTVVAATMIVTLFTALTFLVLGTFRLGNLARFIPYPVVGGFLAGTGWLLMKGGIAVAASTDPQLGTIGQFVARFELVRWLPAFAFGVVLLVATRIVRRALVIPAVLVIGLVAFAIGLLVTGTSIQDAREGLWLLGPFRATRLWQLWTYRALTSSGTDWSAVFHEVPGMATAVFVAVIGCLFNVGGAELLLHTDLDSNREVRDVGLLNVVSGLFGGIPGYHALSLTALAKQMDVDGRGAGLVAALVPLATVAFGASIVGLIPRMIVGGVLVFVGLSLLVAWLVDMRRSLPLGEYLIVPAIVLTIATKGIVTGLEVGLLLAVVLFAVNYGRIDLVREVPFGAAFRSNVDRPPGDRVTLEGLADRVQILRLNGFVFFGTARGLLERISNRAQTSPLRFLLIDLRRVTGVDASGVFAFRKVALLAEASGFEVVFADTSDRVHGQLERGGLIASDGFVRFEADLDHSLQRCEDELLAEAAPEVAGLPGDGSAVVPPDLETYLERRSLPEGTVLIRQGDRPDEVFVLESGGLRVEWVTPDGARVRLNTVRPGVMVGEVALYTGLPRTADVIAEVPSVVLAISRASIQRLEAEEPARAAALHRWLATTLAVRLTDAQRVYSALLD